MMCFFLLILINEATEDEKCFVQGALFLSA